MARFVVAGFMMVIVVVGFSENRFYMQYQTLKILFKQIFQNTNK